jgi:hypothetical protein
MLTKELWAQLPELATKKPGARPRKRMKEAPNELR